MSEPVTAGDGGGDGPDGDAQADLDRTLESREMPESVTCPFCDAEDTEPFSAFGSSLSVSQYYCNGCRSVFEWMKWRRREERGD